LDQFVNTLAVLPSGDLIVAGNFSSAGGVPVSRIARWNGTAWSALRGWTNDVINALAVHPNGDLIAGGNFTTAGVQVSAYVARYSSSGAPEALISPAWEARCTRQTVTLTASAYYNFSDVSFQWHRNGLAITDGEGGASQGGGIVSGASGTFPSPTSNATTTLTISLLEASDAGSYTCTFTNACGSATTSPATLTVVSCEPPCGADFNQDGGIDGADYEPFFVAWEAGLPAADVNADGGVDGSDIETFLTAWEAGGC
jgi:hypothetical protein